MVLMGGVRMSLFGRNLQGVQGTKKELIKTRKMLANKADWKIIKVPKPTWNYLGKWKPIYEFSKNKK